MLENVDEILPLEPTPSTSNRPANPNHGKRNTTKGKKPIANAPTKTRKPGGNVKAKAVRTTGLKKRKIN